MQQNISRPPRQLRQRTNLTLPLPSLLLPLHLPLINFPLLRPMLRVLTRPGPLRLDTRKILILAPPNQTQKRFTTVNRPLTNLDNVNRSPKLSGIPAVGNCHYSWPAQRIGFLEPRGERANVGALVVPIRDGGVREGVVVAVSQRIFGIDESQAVVVNAIDVERIDKRVCGALGYFRELCETGC